MARNVTKRDSRALWGIGDLLTSADTLTRNVPIELRWLPPIKGVRIYDSCLVFELAKPDHVLDGAAIFDSSSALAQAEIRNIESRKKVDMLRQFVELYNLPDRKILAYAKVWGRLRLCQHNVPYQHGRLQGTPEALLNRPVQNPDLIRRIQQLSRSELSASACAPLLWEPIETWRFFSKQANAMLAIAARLHGGLPGDDSDWDCVLTGGFPFHNPSIAISARLNLHRNFLLSALRAWMSMSRFHPWVVNLEGKIHLVQADLFAKLSIELALAISRVQAPAVCSVCGNQYDAVRNPPAGRAHYCGDPNCRREGARLRKARSRQKRTKANVPIPLPRRSRS